MERRWISRGKDILRLGIWMSGLVAVPVAFILWVHPVLGAAVCPQCFGFVNQGNDVFVEKNTSRLDLTTILDDLTAAQELVNRFFGDSERHPRVLVCESRACALKIGSGSAQVGSIASFVLVITPQGRNITLITHELSQIELENRIGIVKQFTGALPAWFEQGLDVLVSDDPNYLTRRGKYSDRCLADRPGELPAEMNVWLQKANKDPLMYAAAACRVDRWMLKHGGHEGIRTLLNQVSQGASFEQVFAAAP